VADPLPALQPDDFAGNVERFSGFAGLYDSFRPEPPPALASILTSYANVARPELVVDLGSGTGLSTRYWADRAGQVVGVEPSADMRERAAQGTAAANVSYRPGYSHETGLPDNCSQIVTCSQSLHWMAPGPTFEEAARILVSGGVFAAYDCYWPPITGRWEVEAAYEQLMARILELGREQRLGDKLQSWDKAGHLARMKASGRFRYTKEFIIHHADRGSGDRLIGLALSQGSVMSLLKLGLSEEEMGLDRLREIAGRLLGETPQAWHWSVHVRLGIV
jgi:SAM-dependent methyltransferase